MKYNRYLPLLALVFLLGIKDGHIALWKDGHPEPVEVFPFRANLLPSADQEKLQQGIRIDNPAQLAGILEDYLS